MAKKKDFIPFGEEWKKEVRKLNKKQIVDFFAEIANKRLRLRSVLHSRCNAKTCKQFLPGDTTDECTHKVDCIVTQTLVED